MDQIEIIDTNSDNICEYAFCGYKNLKNEGYKRKIEWLKQRYSEGLKFKILHTEADGDVGFIEYIPAEYSWKAIAADGYMVIHCLLIHNKKYQGQGYGAQLLESCLQDARQENLNGVTVIVSQGTWMPDGELFTKHGFESVDLAPPAFELLVKKFKEAPSPKFKGDWENKLQKCGPGLTIFRSDQCPYLAKSTKEILETSKQYDIPVNVVDLKNCKEAQNAPSAFAIFSLVYNGKLIAEHPVSSKRFSNIMDKILG